MLYFRAALSVAIAYSTGALITLLCLGSIPLFARLPSHLQLGLAASASLRLRQGLDPTTTTTGGGADPLSL